MKLIDSFIATRAEADLRLSICRQCDKLSALNVCSMCGCFMPVKVKLRAVECPLRRWGKIPFVPGERWRSDDDAWDEDARE